MRIHVIHYFPPLTIWNKGPERVNKANKMSTVETPPPYDTAVINVQNNAKTSSNVYPSLLSIFLVQKAAVSVHTKGTQRGGAQYNQGILKCPECHYCRKAGHCAR